jgi:hypothetical protein
VAEQQGSPSPDRPEFMDAVVHLLHRQGEKLNPAELLGFLSLFNLLGIVSFLNKGGNSTPRGLEAFSTLAQDLAKKETGGSSAAGSQSLLHNLMALLESKGGQKLNPASLLALVNLLGETGTKEKEPEPPEQEPKGEQPPASQEQSLREEKSE